MNITSDMIPNDTNFLKKHGNIYISDSSVEILKKYNIDVYKYNNVASLIYDIEEILNNSYTDMEDLEWVSENMQEYNYYNNTNK